MDLKLSYSRISTYLQCPYKYYLSYIVKLPTKPRPYFSFGSSIHTVLEWLHKPRILPVNYSIREIIAYYDENWINRGYSGIDEESRYKELGKSILISYWEKMEGSFKPALEVEKNFSYPLQGFEGVTLTGIVDRIDLDESGDLILTDYKTGKWIPSSVNGMDTLQLSIYAIAMSSLWDKKVAKVSNLYLREHKEVAFIPTQEKITDAMTEIDRAVTGIRNKEFDLKVNKFCNWCDYKNRCKTTQVLSVER